jgi:precorrin-2 dehydrogenase / sirohydrochlorin ferrochelatase
MSEAGYLPIFVRVRGSEVLVVGGGGVAERKVRMLLEHGARVRLVSPQVTAGLAALLREDGLVWEQRAFRAEDVSGFRLVFAATDDPAVNRAVFVQGEAAGCLVNSADDPEHCHFILGSLLRRGELTVAVSTGGTSPALAAYTRREIERLIGEEYGQAAALLGRLRRHLLEPGHGTSEERGRLLRKLVDCGIPGLLKAGDLERLDGLLRDIFGLTLAELEKEDT